MTPWHVELLPTSQPQGEKFILRRDGSAEEVALWDYATIYAIPGLYEHVVQDRLRCQSPAIAARTIQEAAPRLGYTTAELRVLDLGAGNGVAGELLRQLGVERIVGVDNIEAARVAAFRDRPATYDAYLVADLERLDAATISSLGEERFNCLLSVGALGGGHIPPQGLLQAIGLIEDGGLIVFTIHEKWLQPNVAEGFSSFLKTLADSGEITVDHKIPFTHRFTTTGDPITFFVITAHRHRVAVDRLAEY